FQECYDLPYRSCLQRCMNGSLCNLTLRMSLLLITILCSIEHGACHRVSQVRLDMRVSLNCRSNSACGVVNQAFRRCDHWHFTGGMTTLRLCVY
ncbi:hypothetical protein T310_10239, partial [Rasamsonia emersonii CBS 393.64]